MPTSLPVFQRQTSLPRSEMIMHASSLENMEKCYRKYIVDSDLAKKGQIKVLDIGGANVNGNYSDIFSAPNVEYIAADIHAGEGVSVVLEDPSKLPFDDCSIDTVICGQVLEHCQLLILHG